MYSRMSGGGRSLVDESFSHASPEDIAAMGLPPLMDVKRDAAVLYHGDQQKQDDVLNDYRLAVAVRGLGASLRASEIARRTGLDIRSISNLLRSVTKPQALALMMEANRPNIPSETSADFASFLGFALSAGGGRRKDEIVVASQDFELPLEFERLVKRLFGCDCYTTESSGVVYKHFKSRKMMKYLEVVTEDFTSLPWEYLSTTEERKAFLKAYLSNHSVVSMPHLSKTGKVTRKPSVDITRKIFDEGDESLLKDMRILLLSQGFASTWHSTGDFTSVVVFDESDLKRMSEGGFFIHVTKKKVKGKKKEETKQARLERALAEWGRLSRTRRMMTRADYHNFKSQVDSGVDWHLAAEKADIPMETARRWKKGRQLPDSVKWELDVEKLKSERRPDEIGYAFRHLTKFPGEARKLASEHTMGELADMVFRKDIGRLIDSWYDLANQRSLDYALEVAYVMVKSHSSRHKLKLHDVVASVLRMMGERDRGIRDDFMEFLRQKRPGAAAKDE